MYRDGLPSTPSSASAEMPTNFASAPALASTCSAWRATAWRPPQGPRAWPPAPLTCQPTPLQPPRAPRAAHRLRCGVSGPLRAAVRRQPPAARWQPRLPPLPPWQLRPLLPTTLGPALRHQCLGSGRASPPPLPLMAAPSSCPSITCRRQAQGRAAGAAATVLLQWQAAAQCTCCPAPSFCLHGI